MCPHSCVPLFIGDPGGAWNGYSSLEKHFVSGVCHVCVFPHLLCTLSMRKIRIKFIFHCFFILGSFPSKEEVGLES